MLEDATYDAIVVDVRDHPDGATFVVTITAGAHKGDVVELVARGMDETDALARLGEPCTVDVRAGRPHVRFA